VDPADALESLLLTAGVAAQLIPPGLEARAGRWRDFVAGKKILLVLDDAVGHAQVRPLLPGTAGSLVLITSRRRLTALEDATVVSLDTLPPGEAAALMARLTSRPDLGSGTGPGTKITLLCGYLPLAIGMIAGQLRHHPAWTGAELAAQLAATRDRLALMRAENLSVTAAFDLSYADLTPGPQRLFRRLGLVPGPSVDAYAAAALDNTSLGEACQHLGELYDQHLIGEPAPARYQLHDLLREHARALIAAADPAESDAAMGRLLDYYLHTALAAAAHTTMTAVQGHPPPGPPPTSAPRLSTFAQAVTWLETEGPNLYAATHRAAASGRTLHAVQIPAAIGDFLRGHGGWDHATTLHRIALATARQAGDGPGQALALKQLGILAWQSGDFPAAEANLTQAVALYGEAGDRPGQAYALTQLGMVHQQTGDYPASLASRGQALTLARGAADRLAEAVALNHLSLVQRLIGDYPAAAASVKQALEVFCGLGHLLGEADALGNLGITQRDLGEFPAAAASLTRSLMLFRDRGDRVGQAWVLNDLGLLQQLTGDYAAAAASHRQALELHRDLGNLAGLADALNNLGKLSSRTSATCQARDHHNQALVLARDIGVPLEEARALEGIGHSHLQDGRPGQGLDYLRQAFEIFERIGSPRAQLVRETLRQHGLSSRC